MLFSLQEEFKRNINYFLLLPFSWNSHLEFWHVFLSVFWTFLDLFGACLIPAYIYNTHRDPAIETQNMRSSELDPHVQ